MMRISGLWASQRAHNSAVFLRTECALTCKIAMVEEEPMGEVEVHVGEVIGAKVKVEDAIEVIV